MGKLSKQIEHHAADAVYSGMNISMTMMMMMMMLMTVMMTILHFALRQLSLKHTDKSLAELMQLTIGHKCTAHVFQPDTTTKYDFPRELTNETTIA